MCLDVMEPKLQPGANALDVGCGSGYLTVVMAHMVGPKGSVWGIDHIPELVEMSVQNAEKADSDVLDKIAHFEGAACLLSWLRSASLCVSAVASILSGLILTLCFALLVSTRVRHSCAVGKECL